jgi:chromosomal replication initiator protein
MLTPQEAWQATLGQLQLQLNRATFDTWLKGAELLAYEDGEFIVRVRHAYAKDWLEKHLSSQINRALSAVFQRTAQVNFVVYLPNRQNNRTDLGPLFAADGTNEKRTESPLAAKYMSLLEEQAEQPQRDYSEWDPRVSNIRYNEPESRADNRLPLDPDYTFEGFVAGPSNQLAYAAAQAVAANPGARYNPLVIYGGTGLGKTHLLHAIAHISQRRHAVLIVTAETFTNELLSAIRSHKTEDMRERYRGVDLLLLDDFQFIAGKASTEEEFYHTLNAILGQGGQVVLTCNQHPGTMDRLDERLRSRLLGGLLVDVQQPEPATRLSILHLKAEQQGVILPDPVAQVLAYQATTNVRELEGLLTQVLARATLTGQALTTGLAQQVVGQHVGASQSAAVHPPAGVPQSSGPVAPPLPPRRRRSAHLSEVLAATANYHQLSLDDLLSKRRTKEIVRARQIAMYLAREETDASLPEIGDVFGGRTHTTVLHGYEKIAASIEADPELRQEVDRIRRQLYSFDHTIN